MAKTNFTELNSTIRYVMFSVFSFDYKALYHDRSQVVQEAGEFFASLDESVVIRGLYDISGLRADADYLIWWHAPTVEILQASYKAWLRTTHVGQVSTAVWSTVALHRPAEFNKSHIPAFLRDEPPGGYVCVYPFVRSYDWYLLPEEERRSMLAEHGVAAREYLDVRANTVSSFALGDYEWILAFEGPQLHRIVDLMRHLRNTQARLYVREETPFFTGPRVSVEELFS